MKRIEIKGPIISNDDQWIYDWLEMESTSPSAVIGQLPDNGEDIEVIINSGGGDVYAGSEIYTELKSYTGPVTVKVVGLAASAASVIAMAGDQVLMSPTANMMIHNVSTIGAGDHEDFEQLSKVLSSHDRSIASAYELKTGKSMEELLGMMNDETWMNAEDAVDKGFADEIMFQQKAPELVAAVNTPLVPDSVKEKVRMLNKQKDDTDAALNNEKLQEIISRTVEEVTNRLSNKENQIDEPEDQENKYSRFFF